MLLQQNSDFAIREKYNIGEKNVFEPIDYFNIVYPPDIPALKEDLTEVLEAKKDYHEKEYRLVNKS